jgi:predicted DNA-binding transcriptional regulator AlpA
VIPMPESLLTVEELAEWIGKTPKAIYDLRYRGDPGTLPLSIDVGGSVRYDPADVRGWLGRQKERSRRDLSDRTSAIEANDFGTRTRTLQPVSKRVRVQMSHPMKEDV